MAKSRRQSNNDVSTVGDIVHSILSEAQFQALRGSNWVLCDGRSVAGSKLATQFGISNVPDARGQFLRGKNNGRADGNEDAAGERALGHFQNDALQNIIGSITNVGTISTAGTHVASGALTRTASAAGNNGIASGGNAGSDVTFNASNSVGARTSTETRPKNIAVNIFIRIN
jgi:hypothetical protein